MVSFAEDVKAVIDKERIDRAILIGHSMGGRVIAEAAGVYTGITVPVISINTTLWPTMPEENRKYITNYQLFYIEDTGHFPMLEQPEECNHLLKKAGNRWSTETRGRHNVTN